MIGEYLNNRYQIKKKIGEGGMALVYEAKDKLLNRKVAIKVLRSQFANDTEFVERFRQEAQAVASFSHPNIVNIFDIGKDNGTHYIVMENVKGETLKERIEQEDRLDVVMALEITKQISEALVVAHRKQIVHCDIKPANILLTPEGRAKLTDFGIARALTSATLKQTETVIGSAHYFSPEQAKGDKIDDRSDIYSLGVVLYEMVTGEVPFKGETPVSVALKHIKDKPTLPTKINPNLSLEVESIILKALNKESRKRYSSIVEMLEAIKIVINNKNFTSQALNSNDKMDLNQKTIVVDKNDYPTDILDKEELQEEIEKDESQKESTIENNKQDDGMVEKRNNAKKKRTKKAPFLKRNWKKVIGALILILIIGSSVWGYYQVMDFLNVPIVKVPDLIGKDLKSAREELAKEGLKLEIYNRNYNNQIPEGHIISQYPKQGKEVKSNRDISVVVSKGARLTEVPKVVEKTLREAKISLDEADLKLGKVTFVFNDQIEKGLVINQDPSSQAKAKINSKVNLIVSKGKKAKPVVVPNLVGLNEENAKQRLRNLNLIIGEVKYQESLNYFKGQVMAQEPKASTKLSAGSPVNLTISSGIRNLYGSEVHQFRVRININPGQEDQRVKIVVNDDNGRRIIYNKLHHPGDLVNKKVISVGSTVVQVFINNSLVREQRL
ncbi:MULTISPECIES: Stk1 family PASTA domain-containing Ser/Thr kinase [unclassified Candidatus Frackibacter]|uniref:Stk1 family PASTA domain-containing Ser/Thr kinase n=1 Tax=unclassified Candidatus Frackibacter TaxID=2648818 RepID=UPI00088D25AC|nr:MULTISPECIES: Stk1 family PASTA domain-containing Ser/Thr kinase [unclassified Candidatus Frackibacter]SDC57543.1 serine/threonine protein kinase [Candidatus Frackibacter sp. WG11]SEM71642.1 serine/threonine protein kinase [Candidatus Frackibacter sp. WG12]SFL82637.1 serine/threonine protein kinase [Candidatus Frackibacter sp. WG13]